MLMELLTEFWWMLLFIPAVIIVKKLLDKHDGR